MRKFLLVVLIGMVLVMNIYGIAMDIYNTYFVEVETEHVPNTIEVIYAE